MKTFEKAVTGFNHNIKHQGQVYHVQTEDSGVKNPHLITHVFVGGNILATKKTSYSELLGSANLSEVVRDLMQSQHKQMLRNLVSGAYDNVNGAAAHYQPGELAAGQGAQPRPVTPVPAVAPPPPPAIRPQVKPPVSVRISAEAKVKPLPLTQVVSGPRVAAARAPPPRAPSPVPLPPEVIAARQLPEAPRENNQGVETLFGEDLISEKSLDEVILSYLASSDG